MISQLWFRRILGICPVLIAVLWVAGIAHFRDYEFTPGEWAVLVAVAFTLHILSNRMRRPRPVPQLPEGANPITMSALAALILAVLIAFAAGLLEWLAEPHLPTRTPWALRTLWHAACGFA
ncbi:MAG: hypothetical protein KDC48_20635, partial [Planctomycetes bacterium]|nr:hypothetical protein [Planctomycetota bacterium]